MHRHGQQFHTFKPESTCPQHDIPYHNTLQSHWRYWHRWYGHDAYTWAYKQVQGEALEVTAELRCIHSQSAACCLAVQVQHPPQPLGEVQLTGLTCGAHISTVATLSETTGHNTQEWMPCSPMPQRVCTQTSTNTHIATLTPHTTAQEYTHMACDTAVAMEATLP